MNIIIEKAQKEQCLEILTVNKKGWYQAYKDIIDQKEMGEHFEYKFSNEGIERFKNYIDKSKNFYVAIDKENDKIVGYIDFGMCKWDPLYKEYGEIHAIYVVPECQRHNIGQKLLNFAIESFKAQHINKILLTTFQKNLIGLNFYKKNEFIIEKKFPRGTWHDNSVDECLLVKEL